MANKLNFRVCNAKEEKVYWYETPGEAYLAMIEWVRKNWGENDSVLKAVEYIRGISEGYDAYNPYKKGDWFGIAGVITCEKVEADKTNETNEKTKSSAYLNKTRFCTYMMRILNIYNNKNEAIDAVTNLFGSGAVDFFDGFTGLSVAADLLEEMVGDITGAIRYFMDECDCDFDRFCIGIDEDFEVKNCSDLYDYIAKYCRTEEEE